MATRNNILLAFGISLFSSLSFGQQEPMFNQYQFAPMIYNPAYVGVSNTVDISLFRNQKWGNYGEGFIANQLSVASQLKSNHGIGINLYSDYVGITSKLRAYLLYSYRVKFNEDMGIRAGVALGVVDNRIDFSNAIVTDPNDPLFSNIAKDRRTMFDMNVGLQYYYKDLHVGFSVPQVLGTKLTYGDETGFYTLERQMIGSVGYTWTIKEEKGMFLNPEALVIYTPGAPFNYSFNLTFEMSKYFWVGAAYKADYAIGISAGVNMVKNLKIGLAYDLQISDIASYNTNPNAEIMLKYSIPARVEKVQDNDSLFQIIADQEQEIDSLKGVINKQDIKIQELEDENQMLKDSLAKWPEEISNNGTPTNDTSNHKVGNPDDHFVELSGLDTPSGYYIITGAFANKSNADRLLKKIKSKFPNARVIMNERNNLYYVLLFHSEDKNESLAYQSYKAKQVVEEETWVLHYTRGSQ